MLSDLAKKLKVAGAMVATAGAFACASPAQAAQFTGAWDPLYGAPFTGLYWKGTATFYIPDQCLSLDLGNATIGGSSATTPTNDAGCTGTDLKLVSADVELYGSFSQHLLFNTSSLDVTSMDVTGGALSSVVGQFDYYVKSNLDVPAGNGDASGNPAWFQLRFLGNVAQLAWAYSAECPDDDEECGTATTVLTRLNAEYCLFEGGVSQWINGNEGPLITFARVSEVPEPGSFALLLPALGMLAAFRRRKTATA